MTQCPHCHRTLSIPDSLAGQAVSCPSCNQTFTAPGGALPPHQTPAPAAAPQGGGFAIQTEASRGGSSPSSSRFQRRGKDHNSLIVILLIANLVFSMVSAGWCLLAEYRIYKVKQGLQESMQEIQREIDSGDLFTPRTP